MRGANTTRRGFRRQKLISHLGNYKRIWNNNIKYDLK